jgi:hypothetical protein
MEALPSYIYCVVVTGKDQIEDMHCWICVSVLCRNKEYRLISSNACLQSDPIHAHTRSVTASRTGTLPLALTLRLPFFPNTKLKPLI